MKRHPALEPFSRDHNDGLILARHLVGRSPDAVEEFKKAWSDELRDHFDEEERLLGGLAGDLAGQLRDEHAEIARLAEGLPGSGERLGAALEAHIRWEERVLFPAIEAVLDSAAAEALSRETLALERRRWTANPMRERLVRRRLGESEG